MLITEYIQAKESAPHHHLSGLLRWDEPTHKSIFGVSFLFFFQKDGDGNQGDWLDVKNICIPADSLFCFVQGHPNS